MFGKSTLLSQDCLQDIYNNTAFSWHIWQDERGQTTYNCTSLTKLFFFIDTWSTKNMVVLFLERINQPNCKSKNRIESIEKMIFEKMIFSKLCVTSFMDDPLSHTDKKSEWTNCVKVTSVAAKSINSTCGLLSFQHQSLIEEIESATDTECVTDLD